MRAGGDDSQRASAGDLDVVHRPLKGPELLEAGRAVGGGEQAGSSAGSFVLDGTVNGQGLKGGEGAGALLAPILTNADGGGSGGTSCTARKGGSIVGCVFDGGSEQLAKLLRGVDNEGNKLMQLRWEETTQEGRGRAVIDLKRRKLLSAIGNPFKRRTDSFVPRARGSSGGRKKGLEARGGNTNNPGKKGQPKLVKQHSGSGKAGGSDNVGIGVPSVGIALGCNWKKLAICRQKSSVKA